jgi:hypothetical protein
LRSSRTHSQFLKQPILDFINDIKTQKRSALLLIVMCWAVFVWLFRWQSGVLPHQLSAPVLVQPNLDITYWIFIASGAAEFCSRGAPAYIMSSLLLGLPLLSILYRKKAISAYFALFYAIILFLYTLLYNTYTCIHTSYLFGLWFVSFTFLFFDAQKFGLAWEGVRYYTCWIYASSFMWKLVRGFWNYPLHAKAIIMHENAAYLLQNPDTYLAKALQFLIVHEQFAHYFLNIGMLIQGVFILGFFTKKYDKLLFCLPFCFHFTTYFLLDVNFMAFLILQLAFIGAWKET